MIVINDIRGNPDRCNSFSLEIKRVTGKIRTHFINEFSLKEVKE